jgi:hypothetical protein
MPIDIMPQRKSYTAVEKLEILKVIDERPPDLSAKAVCASSNVQLGQVSRWRKIIEQLKSCCRSAKSLCKGAPEARTTLNRIDARTVNIRCRTNSTLRVTVGVTVTVNGIILPPIIIFKVKSTGLILPVHSHPFQTEQSMLARIMPG